MILVLVGALVITALAALFTFYFFGTLYLSIGMAGWDCVKEDGFTILVCFLGVVLSWVFWWFVIGTNLHINISVGV